VVATVREVLMADAFQTTLTLVRQSNGLYTLNALTTTPDSCRIADPARLGAVVGQPVPSDARQLRRQRADTLDLDAVAHTTAQTSR
jgi:transcriptional regulator of met regulon